jgi:ADP-ribose pyrophosphatase YjhB (NUDIX family)
VNLLALLEELRSIAHLGLNYAENPYDRERYERLMRLATEGYAEITSVPQPELNALFRQELGYITPKVGTTAAIFNDQGQILLIKRSDNGCWGMPAGFCEVNLTVQDNLRREVREETGLEVEVHDLLEIYCRMAGEYGLPHTVYSLLYLCTPSGGALTPSHETPELGYFDLDADLNWHMNHQQRAARAQQRWLTLQK